MIKNRHSTHVFLIFFIMNTTLAKAMNLQERWTAEFVDPFSQISLIDQENIKKHHVLFIPGFLNELASISLSYFGSSQEAVFEMGMTSERIHSSSFSTSEENIWHIFDQIKVHYRETQKPLILMGHSKGGVELLLTILSYPELITDGIVEKFIMIQAPLAGEHLAEKTRSSSLTIKFLHFINNHGMKSLTPNYTQQAIKNAFETFGKKMGQLANKNGISQEDLEKKVSDRCFYVRSFATPYQYSWSFSLIVYLVGTNPNRVTDGLISIENQYIKNFGTDLGIINTDHLGLALDHFSSTSGEQKKAFMRALLAQIFVKK